MCGKEVALAITSMKFVIELSFSHFLYFSHYVFLSSLNMKKPSDIIKFPRDPFLMVFYRFWFHTGLSSPSSPYYTHRNHKNTVKLCYQVAFISFPAGAVKIIWRCPAFSIYLQNTVGYSCFSTVGHLLSVLATLLSPNVFWLSEVGLTFRITPSQWNKAWITDCTWLSTVKSQSLWD